MNCLLVIGKYKGIECIICALLCMGWVTSSFYICRIAWAKCVWSHTSDTNPPMLTSSIPAPLCSLIIASFSLFFLRLLVLQLELAKKGTRAINNEKHIMIRTCRDTSYLCQLRFAQSFSYAFYSILLPRNWFFACYSQLICDFISLIAS